MNFFVSVKGNRIADNLTKEKAVKEAIKQHDLNPELCGLDIGIGRRKLIENKWQYVMIPYSYFII